jgi:predicted amidohydrolase
MCSGRDIDRNVARASELIREAARGGAAYVQTPENTILMELERPRLLAAVRPEAGNPALAHFQGLARELGIWLHIGSMPVLLDDGGKFANRSYLIAPDGSVAARYDKIHMFDVDLGGGESYLESANYQPGRQAVVAELPWGGLGLTICYDLRFPKLYRALAKAGAKFLAIPAAFTRPTGIAHWHTLLRARAIESQAYVFAAVQGGKHENGRETFGHSLVVSPWGEILGEGDVQPAVIVADIDLQLLEDVRRRVPSLQHDRDFDVVHAAKLSPGEVSS